MHHLPAPLFANLRMRLVELAFGTGLQLLLFWKGGRGQLRLCPAINTEIS